MAEFSNNFPIVSTQNFIFHFCPKIENSFLECSQRTYTAITDRTSKGLPTFPAITQFGDGALAAIDSSVEEIRNSVLIT